jgi:hypothetical protein
MASSTRGDEQSTLPELGRVVDHAGRDFMRHLFQMQEQWTAVQAALQAKAIDRALAVTSAMLTTRRLMRSAHGDLVTCVRELQSREEYARHALCANERGLRILIQSELFRATEGTRLREALATFRSFCAFDPVDGPVAAAADLKPPLEG